MQMQQPQRQDGELSDEQKATKICGEKEEPADYSISQVNVATFLFAGAKAQKLIRTFTALAQASAPTPKGVGFHLFQATTTRETP